MELSPKNVYLTLDRRIINDFSEESIETLYDEGYLFTRIDKGVMDQTRSLRINLPEFEFSSENRRVLRKTEELSLEVGEIPYTHYNWLIGKMGKDFYTHKKYKGPFTANKIKELLTNQKKSNFNRLFIYSESGEAWGYAICLETNHLLHYSYPFYNLDYYNKDVGMGMMVKAIQYAKEHEKRYVYLGSAHLFSHTYKLQFRGLEWFNYEKKQWDTNIEKLKEKLYSYKGFEQW